MPRVRSIQLRERHPQHTTTSPSQSAHSKHALTCTTVRTGPPRCTAHHSTPKSGNTTPCPHRTARCGADLLKSDRYGTRFRTRQALLVTAAGSRVSTRWTSTRQHRQLGVARLMLTRDGRPTRSSAGWTTRRCVSSTGRIAIARVGRAMDIIE